MRVIDRTARPSWFGSAAGHRYMKHFGLLLGAKALLLALLYVVFIAPQSRADTSPAATYRAVTGAPASQAHP